MLPFHPLTHPRSPPGPCQHPQNGFAGPSRHTPTPSKVPGSPEGNFHRLAGTTQRHVKARCPQLLSSRSTPVPEKMPQLGRHRGGMTPPFLSPPRCVPKLDIHLTNELL